MSFRSRLILYFGSVVILPLLLSLLYSGVHLRAGLDYEVDRRLRECAHGLREAFAAEEGELLRRNAALEVTAEVQRYRATGARAALLARLVVLREQAGLDLLEIGDARGIVVARGHKPDDWGEDKRQTPIVAQALRGQTAVDVEGGVNGFALRAVSPVRAGGGIIGTLMTGRYLSQARAEAYRRLTGLETGFYFHDGSSSTTLPALALAPLVARLAGEEEITATVAAEGAEYRVLLLPLRRHDGTSLGAIVTAAAAAASAEYYRKTLAVLLLNAAFGLALALLIVVLLARRVTRPLRDLTQAMDALGSGQLAARIPTEGNDEFGRLERNFNLMAEHLEQATSRLRQTQAELQHAAKLALAGKLLAEVAHEVRNPLNGLNANLALLEKEARAGDQERCVRRLTVLRAEIARLNAAVSGFLAEVAPLAVKLHATDVAQTLRQALEFTAAERAARGITLRAEGLDGPLPLAHDGDLMYRALLNLLQNAAESMPGGGTLTVQAQAAGAARTVKIRDTGCGLTAAEQQRVMEPFFTTKGGGTGLGLTFVLKAVEAHGGELHLESWPGQGTEITLTFPGAGTEKR